MKTAVVMPLFNGAAWVEKALADIFAQSARPSEVVVVDDGSTDGSTDIVRRHPGVRLLPNPSKGANPARAHGAASTRAPFVAMLDQDDRWHPRHLETLEALLDGDAALPAAVAAVSAFDDGAEPALSVPPDRAPSILDPWEFFPANPISVTGQVLMRRASLEAVGGWIRRRGVADYQAWLALGAGLPFRSSGATTSGRRIHRAASNVALRGPRFRNEFLGWFLEAAEESLALRLRHHPEDGPRIRARLDLAKGLAAWVASPGSAAFATKADALLAGQPAAVVERILGQVLYFQHDAAPNRETLRKGLILARLLWRCPLAARRLRACILDRLTARVRTTASRSLARVNPWGRLRHN
jgi:glycosyltransferase involved in cell wall biosynthesis